MRACFNSTSTLALLTAASKGCSLLMSNKRIEIYLICIGLGEGRFEQDGGETMKAAAKVEETAKAKSLTPADFVKKPSTNLLKKKIEGWKNTVLVSGTVRT